MYQISNQDAKALCEMLSVIRRDGLTLQEENRLRRGILAIRHLQRKRKP